MEVIQNQGPAQKGNRSFKDFRFPGPGKKDEFTIDGLKRKFIELIRAEFLEADKKLIIDENLKPVIKFCFNWVLGLEIDVKQNKGIQLVGDVGLGKSCILKAVHKMVTMLYDIVAIYITANKIARLFKHSNEENEIAINRLIYCRLLFIDDIGTEDLKVYDSFPVQEIIRERYDHKRIISFTTNIIDPEDLRIKYSKSIEDKLSHSTFRIEFKGTTKR